MDRAIINENSGPRVGYFRIGVYRDDWEKLLQRFSTFACFNITRRALSLGDPDSTTGWYAKNYTEKTIDMIIIPRGATQALISAGLWAHEDAVGLTADPIKIGDQVKTKEEVYYEVVSVRKVFFGDSFSHYICDLKELPLYKES